MKKIISGKIYDTATAKKIGVWSNNSTLAAERIIETLYKKRTGEYFLMGEGGSATKYAVSDRQGGWSGGTILLPMDWQHAREWAQHHLSEKDYEAFFGEIAKDESRTTITLSLSASSIEVAKRAASQAGISLSAYIESLVCSLE